MRAARATLSGFAGSNTAYGHSRPDASAWWRTSARRCSTARCSMRCAGARRVLLRGDPEEPAAASTLAEPRFLAGLEAGAPDRRAPHRGPGRPDHAPDNKSAVNDGLPETLEEVIARYGHRWFKLKVGGDAKADVERLSAIAAVLDRIREPYQASLDGNEQYEDVEACSSSVARDARRAAAQAPRRRASCSSSSRSSARTRSSADVSALARGEAGDHRRVRRFARRVPAREGARLQGRVVQDLQGNLQVAASTPRAARRGARATS